MKNHLPDFVKKRFKVSLDDLPEVDIGLFSISANAGISTPHTEMCALCHILLYFSPS
jgi:hypothetical protein